VRAGAGAGAARFPVRPFGRGGAGAMTAVLSPGHLRLTPGVPLPTVQGGRPDLAARLARGRRAADLPALLGALYTLCSHAHRSTARRAVAAAFGQPARCSIDERQALRAATARDQVLRLVHDWPRLLGTPDAGGTLAQRLADCPLWNDKLPAADRMAALRGWLERRWLHRPLTPWLARHATDPAGWPRRWCLDAPSPLATLLRHEQASSSLALTGSRPLAVLARPHGTGNDIDAGMADLAAAMSTRPDFCARPTWRGTPAETGPWTRAHDSTAVPAHSAWERLVARLVDVLRLDRDGAWPAGAPRAARWPRRRRAGDRLPGARTHRVELPPAWRAGAGLVDLARTAGRGAGAAAGRGLRPLRGLRDRSAAGARPCMNSAWPVAS